MRIYISGKISGLPIDEARERFDDAEALLDYLGFDVVNPMKKGLPDDAGWGEHMVKDIELLITCEAIYMMENWFESTGAKIEYDIANRLSMDMWFESNVRADNTDVMRIQNAIHEVLGLRFNEYATKSRKRDRVFARMLFIYHCKQSHLKLVQIAKHVHRDHSSLLHLLNKYDDEVKFNPYFRKVALRVERILNKTIKKNKNNG